MNRQNSAYLGLAGLAGLALFYSTLHALLPAPPGLRSKVATSRGTAGETQAPFVPKPDRFIRDMVQKRPPNDIYGFDIAALWRKESIPELAAVERRYRALAAQVAALPSAETARGKVYIYPFRAFHSTVAALVKFTAPTLAGSGAAKAAERQKYVQAWRAAIDKAFASPRFPRAPARLLMGRPSLSDAAGIFTYENPGGEVAAIRALVREAMRDPALAAAGVSTAEVRQRRPCLFMHHLCSPTRCLFGAL